MSITACTAIVFGRHRYIICLILLAWYLILYASFSNLNPRFNNSGTAITLYYTMCYTCTIYYIICLQKILYIYPKNISIFTFPFFGDCGVKNLLWPGSHLWRILKYIRQLILSPPPPHPPTNRFIQIWPKKFYVWIQFTVFTRTLELKKKFYHKIYSKWDVCRFTNFPPELHVSEHRVH